MSDNTVNIKGIDKVLLLKLLWGIGTRSLSSFLSPFDLICQWDASVEKDAIKAVKKRIESFKGVVIEMDLSGDEVDPTSFDLNFGRGKVKQIVEWMLDDSL